MVELCEHEVYLSSLGRAVVFVRVGGMIHCDALYCYWFSKHINIAKQILRDCCAIWVSKQPFDLKHMSN